MSTPISLWVPGRIEFLGKHTDYAGGRSLLCTMERGIRLVAVPRADHLLRIHDALSGENVECPLDTPVIPTKGHWAIYPMTVARRIARNFGAPLAGADIEFRSDLPPAAGMSSSSALVVGIFMALSAINDLPGREGYRRNIHDLEDLAGYLGCVENGFRFGDLAGDSGVGTLSGSEDQTALLCGRADSLVQYSFCPVRFERVVPMPKDFLFAIASSGVVAEKTAAALENYNRLARRARAACNVWRHATGREDATLGAALASGEHAFEQMRDALTQAAPGEFSTQELIDRLEQFHDESEIVIPRAAVALADGDLDRLGSLVDRSQKDAERMLGNQTPETIWLARSARELGAAAASAFGAGFGGSVWALIPEREGEAFLESWRVRYVEHFPQHAGSSEFFTTRAGSPAGAFS